MSEIINDHSSPYKKRTTRDKNEIIIHDNYAEMILYDNKGNEKARTIIDIEDIDKVRHYKWHLSTSKYVNNNKVGLFHRFILGVHKEQFNYERTVDHINRNQLDNRKCNLRIVCQNENNKNRSFYNMKIYSTNKSGVTGVYWSKTHNKWCASIGFDKKQKHLGFFDSIEDAVEVRIKAEIELLNTIGGKCG